MCKDHAVRASKSLFVKSFNKWWYVYKNEENVLISDVEPSHTWQDFCFSKYGHIDTRFRRNENDSICKIWLKHMFVTSIFFIEDSFFWEISKALLLHLTRNNVFYETVQDVPRHESDMKISVLEVLWNNEPGIFSVCINVSCKAVKEPVVCPSSAGSTYGS